MLVLGLLGLGVGSHVAVLVARWPRLGGMLGGRSRCDSCLHPLSALELVPLLSGVVLRGRCRRCAAPIAALHWRIELAAFAIGVAAAQVGDAAAALALALFGWHLLAIAALDCTRLVLPDRLNAAIAACGLLAGGLGLAPPLADRLAGAAAGFATLWIVRHGYRRIRGREGLGGGDPKLLGAIGCWLGWAMLPACLFLASSLGLGIVLVARLRGRPLDRHARLPFGAMLAIAAFVMAVWHALA